MLAKVPDDDYSNGPKTTSFDKRIRGFLFDHKKCYAIVIYSAVA